MSTQSIPVEVFCSYAQNDEVWLHKLEKHLRLLQRQRLISLWHDRLISPGTDWGTAINIHLETASVILLLVSADFFDSDYCYGVEMKRAREREAAGEVRVIPIVVRSVDWTGAPFEHLQALPTNAKPITMWQDEDTALADVAAGIRRAIEDISLLAASAPRAVLPARWNIPYSRNPFFLGRERELVQVRQYLQADQLTTLSQPLVISGLGGIGKTQLALEYAYRYHQDYQTVLWAYAESTEALVSSYITIASVLRLPEREAKEQEITVQAVKTWLQTHGSWLLILDNADELTLLPGFLPPSLGGHLLLTTRAVAAGRLAHRLEIETLLPEQGATLLLHRAALLAPDAELSQAPLQEQELALQISQEMGGLPLSLDQSGAYLEETGIDLLGYWQLYQQRRTDLLRKRGGLVADHPSPVATTWSLSFQQVKGKNPAATDLLNLCAYLSPDAIPEEILTKGISHLGPVLSPAAADTILLNQAMEALRAYSLIKRDPKRKTLSIHRLVQAVVQDSLEEAQRIVWAQRAVRVVNATFPSKVSYSERSQCERMLPQAMVVAQLIDQYQFVSKKAGQLLYKMASYLRDRARYTEAAPLYKRALSIRKQQVGPEHSVMAHWLNDLAILYREQSKYIEAEMLYQQVLSIRELQGPEHPKVVYPLTGLADIYRKQSKYAEAESFYLRALSICKLSESRHPSVTYLFAYSLTGLADLYREQGKYAEAEPLYQQALSIRELQGPEHPSIAHPLTGLADLYHEQGKYAEAEPLYQRALSIRELQGPEHPKVVYPLVRLADLYHEQGKYTEAEPLYQRALTIQEQYLGSEHPETAETIQALAVVQEAKENH